MADLAARLDQGVSIGQFARRAMRQWSFSVKAAPS
jgi:hypothetical protein